jgi:16S rRNA processing protein RimM
MEFIEIGQILKCQGLRGQLKLKSYLESDDILQNIDKLFLKRGGCGIFSSKLESVHITHKGILVKLEGINDIESAEKWIGCQVLIQTAALERLPKNECYWWEIIGLEVITEDGVTLGIIDSVFPTGSNDVYVCRGKEREILLPAIADVIKKIDKDKGIMIVRLLEGL